MPGVAVSAVSFPLSISLSQISPLPDLSDKKTSFLPSEERAGRTVLVPRRVSCWSGPDTLPPLRTAGSVHAEKSSVANDSTTGGSGLRGTAATVIGRHKWAGLDLLMN